VAAGCGRVVGTWGKPRKHNMKLSKQRIRIIYIWIFNRDFVEILSDIMRFISGWWFGT
jgi:hypothetical protein